MMEKAALGYCQRLKWLMVLLSTSIEKTIDSHTSEYRFPYRRVSISIPRSIDFHTAEYRFPYLGVSISIPPSIDFHAAGTTDDVRERTFNASKNRRQCIRVSSACADLIDCHDPCNQLPWSLGPFAQPLVSKPIGFGRTGMATRIGGDALGSRQRFASGSPAVLAGIGGDAFGYRHPLR